MTQKSRTKSVPGNRGKGRTASRQPLAAQRWQPAAPASLAIAAGLALTAAPLTPALAFSPGLAPATAPLAHSTRNSNAFPSHVHRTKKRSVRIVAKVGDRVITNYQVEARSGLLLQRSPEIRKKMGEKANSYFKSVVRKRWEKIAKSDKFREELKAYVMAKRPTSREEQQKYIQEFARKRQKQLQKSLQGEARNQGMKAVQGSLKKRALENLVEENLKLYEAQRQNVLADRSRADTMFKTLAQRNKKSVKEFSSFLRKSGIDPMTLKDQMQAEESWRNVIRKKFGFQLSMMQSALDKYLGADSEGGNAGSSETSLEVSRVRLASLGGSAGLVTQLNAAERLRTHINGCKDLASAVSATPGARLEDMGQRSASQIDDPVVRSLLMNAKVGDAVPAQVTSDAVELWILCGRSRQASDDNQKTAKRSVDPRQKEFELLARRHLNDVRREVRVEYR
jgi:peptidyl-prolyl cis-trans isomerase SurA